MTLIVTQVKVIGEEDDVDYSTDEAKASVCSDTSSDVMGHVCPEQFSELRVEDLVIWVSYNFGLVQRTQI